MKLTERKKIPNLSSRDVLHIEERQQSLAECLKFMRKGDTERLETAAFLGTDENRFHRLTAQAALHLVGDDVGISRATLERRRRQIESMQFNYERVMRELMTSGYFIGGGSMVDVLKEAYWIFPFTDQLRQPITSPNDEVWNKALNWAIQMQRRDMMEPATCYAYLLAMDVERFHSLDLDEIKDNCFRSLNKQRMIRPASKGFDQKDILKMLAQTRLVFPELIGPDSLKPEERRSLGLQLEKSREAMQLGTDQFSFADIFYHLALVESPRLSVDQAGIHLSTQPVVSQQFSGLPARPEV